MCQCAAGKFSSEGIECSVVPLGRAWIEHCTGCMSCRKDGRCRIDDGMTVFYDVLGDVDLVVFATPIRFRGCSSVIKTFMDRLNPFWYAEKDHPRYAAAMMCSGEDTDFSHALSELRALSSTLRSEWLGELGVSGTDSMEMSAAGEKASEFAAEIIGKL